MANTMTLIASSSIGAGGGTIVNFNSIPQTYTDLMICYAARTTKTSANYANLSIRFNSDTASNYKQKMIYGTGTNIYSATNTPSDAIQWAYVATDGATANTFGIGTYYIPNYSVSGVTKSVSVDSVSENNDTSTQIASSMSGTWLGTAAITSISIVVSGTVDLTMKQYSNFYLYGIKNS